MLNGGKVSGYSVVHGYSQCSASPSSQGNLVSHLSYTDRLYSAQSIFKKGPSRTRQNSQATAGTKFTKPGAHSRVDVCHTPELVAKKPQKMIVVGCLKVQ